jgi:hypothetical protein
MQATFAALLFTEQGRSHFNLPIAQENPPFRSKILGRRRIFG